LKDRDHPVKLIKQMVLRKGMAETGYKKR